MKRGRKYAVKKDVIFNKGFSNCRFVFGIGLCADAVGVAGISWVSPNVPAILGGLGLGPAAGVFIELIKNIIKALSTKTIGAGELANFVVGSAYVLPLSIIYRKWKGKHRLLTGYVVGTVTMCVAGMIVNYFVTLPLYSNMFGGVDALIGFVGSMTPGFLPEINSLWKIIIIGITPFNVLKGIMMAVVSYYVFKLVKKPLQF